MKYLLAPIAALIAGCAVMQPHPKKKAEPLGCRPSGADILLSGEVAKRDMLLCFNPDGTVEWKLGQQKPLYVSPKDRAFLENGEESVKKMKAEAAKKK